MVNHSMRRRLGRLARRAGRYLLEGLSHSGALYTFVPYAPQSFRPRGPEAGDQTQRPRP